MNHAIRIRCSTNRESNPDTVPSPEPPDFKDKVPERIQQNALPNHDEILEEQASPASVMNTAIDGTGTDYVRGVRRFSDADDKSSIIDDIEKNALADAKWYVVESRECDHDESDRSGCGDWVEERSKGSVPNEV